MKQERDNLRAALGWLREEGEAERGLRLTGALGRFWWFRGYFSEGRAQLGEFLELAGAASGRTVARAKAFLTLGVLTYRSADYSAGDQEVVRSGWASYQRSKSVHFIEGCSPVAELLSDEFTVVTYDRRGNSRSPRPGGWDGTLTEEQSDDAGALIEALGIVPAAVFGTSGGAIIGLDLVIRHPELVRGAILHDSAMFSVLPNPEEALGAIQQVVEGGMRRGGPRGGVEAFLRFIAGYKAFEDLDSGLRERMLSNAETFFGLDFPGVGSYHPNDTTLAGVEVPVMILAGAESPPFLSRYRGGLPPT